MTSFKEELQKSRKLAKEIGKYVPITWRGYSTNVEPGDPLTEVELLMIVKEAMEYKIKNSIYDEDSEVNFKILGRMCLKINFFF